MEKKFASALYKENIIKAEAPQENAFFPSGFVFLLFCYCMQNFIFFSNLYDFRPSYVK